MRSVLKSFAGYFCHWQKPSLTSRLPGKILSHRDSIRVNPCDPWLVFFSVHLCAFLATLSFAAGEWRSGFSLIPGFEVVQGDGHIVGLYKIAPVAIHLAAAGIKIAVLDFLPGGFDLLGDRGDI